MTTVRKEPELRSFLTPDERNSADALSVFPANEMELIRLERTAEQRRADLLGVPNLPTAWGTQR